MMTKAADTRSPIKRLCDVIQSVFFIPHAGIPLGGLGLYHRIDKVIDEFLRDPAHAKRLASKYLFSDPSATQGIYISICNEQMLPRAIPMSFKYRSSVSTISLMMNCRSSFSFAAGIFAVSMYCFRERNGFLSRYGLC